ncbi:MAG: iron-sulfur cluster assembly scaffold protein [Candidatus Eremiobacteraeota bacterium]|nr:iron-sulfur cluster assembly scaffold protein [Candidatus Eremiobacteraeota bacterium]
MFSPQTRRYFDNARGFGSLDAPTHQSRVGSAEQGHYFQLQLEIDAHGIVKALAFSCPRCVPAIACGGYLYERLVGRRADQELTVEQIVRDLGGLPPQRCFYAWMAVKAVCLALN